jgi:hypothetical protein
MPISANFLPIPSIFRLFLYQFPPISPFFPLFFSYQCYLKRAKERVVNDLERARRSNLYFAGKLVRFL